jgi:hypothetical protein
LFLDLGSHTWGAEEEAIESSTYGDVGICESPEQPSPLELQQRFPRPSQQEQKEHNIAEPGFAKRLASCLLLPTVRTYKSMFRDSNWRLEPAFLIAKLLRKLAGNLDVPGMLIC